MEDKKILAREYSSVTKCELMEDGYWKAVSETHDRLLREGMDWVDEKIDAMAMDINPQEAIKTAMNSVLQYIMQNVYQNGFSSLVEYREYERSLGKGTDAIQAKSL